jgi:hypothetical protein
MTDDLIVTVQNIPLAFVPSRKPLSRFSRRRRLVSWWLYVEDALSRLSMLLLGPMLGAVIGSAVAVSQLTSVTIDGRSAAAVPSLFVVLWPALIGGVGGVAAVASVWAVVGVVSFYLRGGNGPWEAKMTDDGKPEVVSRHESPTHPGQLGAVDCVLRRPSGQCEWSDQMQRRWGVPEGVIAVGVDSVDEPGCYELRWYATEHKRRIHEVARLKLIV